MVRSFILNGEQRVAIEGYLRDRPSAMSPQVRQIRLRAKKLDFDAMQKDIELLERLAKLKLPKGRKSKDMMALFVVRQGKDADVAGKFTVSSPYGQMLNEFMESGKRLSVISVEDGDPTIVRQALNRLSERVDLPVRAQVINGEVYLERMDQAPQA